MNQERIEKVTAQQKLFEINEQLPMLYERVRRKEVVKKMLRSLNDRRYEVDKKARELDRIRKKEQSDVEKLEGISLATFVSYITGRKEALDKERQEAYEAAIKYNAAMEERAAIDGDIEKYERELRGLTGCEERYEKMFREKSQLIKNTEEPFAEDVMGLEKQIAYMECQQKEIKEAISAGSKAQSMANEVLCSLDEAEGFGLLDIAGGGVGTTYGKRVALEHAQHSATQLQVQFIRFKNELADVTIHKNTQIKIDGFLEFADYFLDGLFVDIVTFVHVKKSQKQMEKTIADVEEVLHKLSEMNAMIEKEKAVVKQKLDELVVNAAQ